MNGLELVTEHEGRRYEIVHDSLVGYYVFRYEGNGPQTTHDYLQDDLDSAIECAEEEFGVSPESWRMARPDEVPANETKT